MKKNPATQIGMHYSLKGHTEFIVLTHDYTVDDHQPLPTVDAVGTVKTYPSARVWWPELTETYLRVHLLVGTH